MQYKKVIVLSGGISQERDVSLESAKTIVTALRDGQIEFIEYDLTANITALINFLQKMKEQYQGNIVVFNALHGKYGEDGRIQGLLDLLKIPYTHSGVLTSSIAMNKILTKKIAAQQGIMIAKEQIYNPNAVVELDFPLVLKPIDEGSSVGVSIINSLVDLAKQIKTSASNYKNLMLEEYIKGRELTVGVINGKALEITEIISKSHFYDYEAKYALHGSKHIISPNLENKLSEYILGCAEKMFKVLKCRGVARVDFILNEQNKLYFLEFNTQPGMTNTSLVPEQARFKGINLTQLCINILTTAEYEE